MALVFGALVWSRRALYQSGLRRATRLGVPVIVVGNLTAGGSGKTPVVAALVEHLAARGRRPGIVSRGYGARIHGIRVLHAEDSADAVGDEPALLVRRGIAPVAIGADRVGAARALLAAHDVDVLVADDGLQHYRLARDHEIVVVDGRRGFGNGKLMPAGPLREPLSRLATVDRVLVSGKTDVPATRYEVVIGGVMPVGGGEGRDLRSFRGERVDAVAGIGDPRRFFDMLARAGVFVVPHPFPDHHRFTAADLDFSDDRPLLMTEKDAVKCAAFARPGWWFVRVDARLDADTLAAVDAVLE